MPDPTSVKEIDLRPIPGKKYFEIEREWREEFIYFLMVDRFQDDTSRPIVTDASRSIGINTPDAFFGGNIKGITH
jgi:alpha-amylase